MADEEWTFVESGQILVPAGMPTVAQIPIPGSNGLTISFWTNAPNHQNLTNPLRELQYAANQLGISNRSIPGKPISTSTIFIQDAAGRRNLRLDYGINKTTGVVDYHWNQKGTAARFGISSHQTAGRAGAITHNVARVYRHVGRGLVVLGVVLDGVAIYQADNRPRKIAEVAGGWAGAWAGCKGGGAAGAWGGSFVGPWGTLGGGIGGCLAGGFGGYQIGSWAGGELYDLSEDVLVWAEDTIFDPVESVPIGNLVLTEDAE